MKRVILTIGLVLIAVNAPVQADTDFYSDGNIISGEEWATVNIYDTPPNHTTVNMFGGTVLDFFTYNASTLNIYAGSINNVISNDYSTLNISGVSVDDIAALDHSVATLSGDIDVLNAYALNESKMNITGGAIGKLHAANEGIMNIYGGAIIEVGIHDNAFINIFGHHDLAKFSSGGQFGYGYVQGYYNDLSWFRMNFTSAEAYSHINLIPEPMTILLLGLGCLFIRKKE